MGEAQQSVLTSLPADSDINLSLRTTTIECGKLDKFENVYK